MCSLYFNKIQLFLVSLKYTAVLKKYYSLCFYELYRNVLKTGTQTKCAQNWHTNKMCSNTGTQTKCAQNWHTNNMCSRLAHKQNVLKTGTQTKCAQKLAHKQNVLKTGTQIICA